jgi:hypothetical protein
MDEVITSPLAGLYEVIFRQTIPMDKANLPSGAELEAFASGIARRHIDSVLSDPEQASLAALARLGFYCEIQLFDSTRKKLKPSETEKARDRLLLDYTRLAIRIQEIILKKVGADKALEAQTQSGEEETIGTGNGNGNGSIPPTGEDFETEAETEAARGPWRPRLVL